MYELRSLTTILYEHSLVIAMFLTMVLASTSSFIFLTETPESISKYSERKVHCKKQGCMQYIQKGGYLCDHTHLDSHYNYVSTLVVV